MSREYVVHAGTIPLTESYTLLGESILRDTFQLAAQALVLAKTSAYRAEQLHEALLFVQGTGLEMTIRAYGLEIDPQALREEFQILCERFKRYGRVPTYPHWSRAPVSSKAPTTNGHHVS